MIPRRMRVLMVSSVHRWDDVRIYHKEARSLAKIADVRLVAVQGRTPVRLPDAAISVECLPLNGAQPGNGEPILLRLRRIAAIARRVLQWKYDVLHFHDPELIPVGWLAKLRGKPVIYDIHEDYPAQILSKIWINRLFRAPSSRLFSFFENLFARRLRFLITAGPILKERFEKINPSTEVIGNFPLSHELNHPTAWHRKNNDICFVGFITRIRGLSEVMEALDSVNGVTLNLAGSFFSKEFEQELASRQAWDKVRHWGWSERETVAKILGISKIGIVTFLPYPNHFDLRSNKMFEYMSAGIPVIASHFPAWKNVIDRYECGICVDPENPEEIAEAIKYLLHNDKIAQQMGANGRQAVEQTFNWEREEKKLFKVYQSILAT
ncbi:MAG: glycosyltransferase family 4 protein [Candidatus Neomarinimicrobiota bacterium]